MKRNPVSDQVMKKLWKSCIFLLVLLSSGKTSSAKCHNNESQPHSKDCKRFFKCTSSGSAEMPCPEGTWFDSTTESCLQPSATDCAKREGICFRVGRKPDLRDCRKYLECEETGLVAGEHLCSAGLCFDSVTEACTLPYHCDCVNTTYDTAQNYKRVCYYTNWSQYRQGHAKFMPQNIDPFLCTHIIYAFANFNYNGEIFNTEWNDIVFDDFYAQVTNLKLVNPGLKVLLAVGGWNVDSQLFSKLVSSTSNIRHFAKVAVSYLRYYNFDGLDIDWEYPANRGSPPEDRERFTFLIQHIRMAFDRESQHGTKTDRLLLTAAVGATEKVINSAYEVKNLSKYLDFINLMTYDFYGAWDKKLGLNAPLFPSFSEEKTLSEKLSVHWVVNEWIRLGASKEKLILGIPFYGRTFKLCSTYLVNPGDPSCGKGHKGRYTKTDGLLSYYEIAGNLQSGWVKMWDDEQKVPYAYSDQEWVGFDDSTSVELKSRYVRFKGIGGVMVWSLDFDDFNGVESKESRYPLMHSIIKVLQPDIFQNAIPKPLAKDVLITRGRSERTLSTWNNGGISQPRHPEPVTSQALVGNQDSDPEQEADPDRHQNRDPNRNQDQDEYANDDREDTGPDSGKNHAAPNLFICPKPFGFFRNPSDCSSYFHCSWRFPYYQQCGPGTLWNDHLKVCDWPQNTGCEEMQGNSSPF